MILPISLLAMAGFTVMTTEFFIVGVLPDMARELQVTVPQAGMLVTLFAFTVASTGPILTALLAKRERKRLFVGVLLLFGLSNTLAALAPNIGVMALARFLQALALPVFWSLASASAVDLVGPEKAGKAISMLVFGTVAATIFGIPIGVLVAEAFNWRSAFGVLALLAFSKALLLLQYFPAARVKPPRVKLSEQLAILSDHRVLGHVALSSLIFTGIFTAYTYIADTLERLAGFDGAMVGWALMAFGGAGLGGNWLAGRVVDRSPLGATLLFSVLLALSLLLVAQVFNHRWILGLTLAAWGAAQAALFTACHVRLMKAAPQAPAFMASLNISGANIGAGLGALAGGYVINHYGLTSVQWAASAILGGALVLGVGLAVETHRKSTRVFNPPA